MKKFFVIFFLLMTGMVASADVINPRLTQNDRLQLIEKRHTEYLERQRILTIKRVCGKSDDVDKKACKAKLKKDYQETIKYLEKDYQQKAK
jgi:hypothetical protein